MPAQRFGERHLCHPRNHAHPSVNSRTYSKSKCPIWCRLQRIGRHSYLFSCTQSCTQEIFTYSARHVGSPPHLNETVKAVPMTSAISTVRRLDYCELILSCFMKPRKTHDLSKSHLFSTPRSLYSRTFRHNRSSRWMRKVMSAATGIGTDFTSLTWKVVWRRNRLTRKR